MRIVKPGGYLAIFLFLLLCYFPLFLHLDSLSLRLWDEARRGVNALEMLQNGNWLVPHYDGAPDMWGTKPPLLVWLQVLFMRLLGPGELAVRLPSALAGLATLLLMGWFSVRHLQRPAIGFFAGLVLLTIPGFLEQTHSVRTGDYDALLTLWLTAGLLFFYLYTEAEKSDKRRRYLWLTALCLILGTLTKGIAGLFFLPGMFVFAIYKKRLATLLFEPDTYLAIGVFLLAAGGYYLLREQFNPGYFQAVWENELFGRYVEGREGFRHGFWYYLNNLWSTRMPFWIFFVPAGGLLGWRAGGRIRELVVLLLTNGLIFLLVISNSESKMAWYDLPVYPSFSLLAAIGLNIVFQMDIKRLPWNGRSARYAFAAFFVSVFFTYPYYRAIEKIYMVSDRGHQWEKIQYGYFIEQNPDFKKYCIPLNENIDHIKFNSHVKFYVKLFNQRGYELSIFTLQQPAPAGARILTCDPVFREALWKLQEGKLHPLIESGTCVLWEVAD